MIAGATVIERCWGASIEDAAMKWSSEKIERQNPHLHLRPRWTTHENCQRQRDLERLDLLDRQRRKQLEQWKAAAGNST